MCFPIFLFVGGSITQNTDCQDEKKAVKILFVMFLVVPPYSCNKDFLMNEIRFNLNRLNTYLEGEELYEENQYKTGYIFSGRVLTLIKNEN